MIPTSGLRLSPLFSSLLLSAAFTASLPAAITIDATKKLHDVPMGFNSTGVGSYHRADFRTGGTAHVDFLTPFTEAKIKIARTASYPDFKADGVPDKEQLHDLTFFDDNLTALKNAGVVAPIIPFYTDPQPSELAPYYAFNGTTVDGTLGSNAAYFVKRYTSAPFNFPFIYLEVHNEPDLRGMDFFYGNPQDYINRFKEIHEALVRHGVRDKVKLCGPVMSRGYYESWSGNTPSADQVKREIHSRIFDAFLAQCGGIVDVITWHTYPSKELAPPSRGGNGQADYEALMNNPKHMDGKFLYNRTVDPTDFVQTSMTAYRGVAALLDAMAANKVPATVKLGITEFGNALADESIYSLVDRALYNLAVSHFTLHNPRMELASSYTFDDYISAARFFGKDGSYTKIYWAQWALGNFTGTAVLPENVTENLNPAGNPYLLVTATRDADKIYVQVINRSQADITDTLAIKGVPLKKGVAIHTLSRFANPKDGIQATASFPLSRTFPAKTATFFTFTISDASAHPIR